MKIKNKWLYLFVENPLKTYNKVKKYFKPLSRFTQFSKVNIGSGFPMHYARILDIRSYDVMWKDKFNSPRHEYDPCISIVFFRKWKIFIDWRFMELNHGELENHSCEYWEAVLDFLYYKKNLQMAVKENTGWYRYNGDVKIYNEYNLLNEPYQSKYNKEELYEVWNVTM